MRNLKFLFLFLYVATFSNITGCSTVSTKGLEEWDSSEFGHPYSGVRNNLKTWPCLLSPPPPFDFPLLYPFAFIIGLTTITIDLGFSAVADTIFLPFDIATTPKEKEYRSSGCGHI